MTNSTFVIEPSMYTLVFGESASADRLLALLGLTREDFHRYRDCFFTVNNQIAVYTRAGANVIIDAVALHAQFLSIQADGFDPTYQTVFFSVTPDQLQYIQDEQLHIEELREPLWHRILDRLKAGADLELQEKLRVQVLKPIELLVAKTSLQEGDILVGDSDWSPLQVKKDSG